MYKILFIAALLAISAACDTKAQTSPTIAFDLQALEIDAVDERALWKAVGPTPLGGLAIISYARSTNHIRESVLTRMKTPISKKGGMNWQFEPALYDGEPVTVCCQLHQSFIVPFKRGLGK